MLIPSSLEEAIASSRNLVQPASIFPTQNTYTIREISMYLIKNKGDMVYDLPMFQR